MVYIDVYLFSVTIILIHENQVHSFIMKTTSIVTVTTLKHEITVSFLMFMKFN